MGQSPMGLARLFVFVFSVLAGCSLDLDRLRAAGARDASKAPDLDGATGIPAGRDSAADLPSADVGGSLTCPTTISGSLDSTDLTQTGRHSRIAPASTCGSAKSFPGNGADTTSAHLYDVYHFVNPSWAAVCFNFTLTYAGDPLYAAAYSSFAATNIATGYLGDVGAVLTSPQTMGVTVGAGVSIYVVVYAIATGNTAVGSYELRCTAP